MIFNVGLLLTLLPRSVAYNEVESSSRLRGSRFPQQHQREMQNIDHLASITNENNVDLENVVDTVNGVLNGNSNVNDVISNMNGGEGPTVIDIDNLGGGDMINNVAGGGLPNLENINANLPDGFPDIPGLPEDFLENLPEDFLQNLPDDIDLENIDLDTLPQEVLDSLPEDVKEALQQLDSQQIVDQIPDEVVDTITDVTGVKPGSGGNTPNQVCEGLKDLSPEELQALFDTLNVTVPEGLNLPSEVTVPDNFGNDFQLPEDFNAPEDFQFPEGYNPGQNLPESVQENIPENLQGSLQNLSGNLQENLPENLQSLPGNLQNNLPGNLQENLQNNLPGNIQENLPENLQNVPENIQNNLPPEVQEHLQNGQQQIQNNLPPEVQEQLQNGQQQLQNGNVPAIPGAENIQGNTYQIQDLSQYTFAQQLVLTGQFPCPVDGTFAPGTTLPPAVNELIQGFVGDRTLPPIEPEHCHGMTVANLTLVINAMPDKDDGLQCSENFFHSKGEKQKRTEMVGMLSGEYNGLIIFYHDTVAETVKAQGRYKGMSCDGMECTLLTRSISSINNGGNGGALALTAPIQYRRFCPTDMAGAKEKNPCLVVDFANTRDGRTFYIRKVKKNVWVSLVKSGRSGYKELSLLRHESLATDAIEQASSAAQDQLETVQQNGGLPKPKNAP